MLKVKRGFTLVELTVVIAILGILVSLSIPSFIRVRAIVRQTIMRHALKTVYNYERLNFFETGFYVPDNGDYWGYLVVNPDNTHYPEDVDLEKLPFKFPQKSRYIYYVFWYKWYTFDYICVYGIASVWDGNDLDGDWGYDFWYVDNYQEEPYPASNDLANENYYW